MAKSFNWTRVNKHTQIQRQGLAVHRSPHRCTESCSVLLIERPYNRHNRWDLRCRATRKHIRWLSDAQAAEIWDMVAHETFSSRRQRCT